MVPVEGLEPTTRGLMAPEAGFEPATSKLTVSRKLPIVLLGNEMFFKDRLARDRGIEPLLPG